MPAVLIHGVMDTHRIWNGVRRYLARADVLTPSLPGFDAPIPLGFDASKEAYVGWLVGELEALGGPVDLVGHDFGCIFVTRVASIRPDLVRTLSAISGPIDAAYEWHHYAKVWQAPGEGERWMADFDPEVFARDLIDDRLSPQDAISAVAFIDDKMKDSVLKLYRSAVDLGAEWGPGLQSVTSPTLVMWGLQDPHLPHRYADRLGEATRAEAVVKLRAGHWPIAERPDVVARELEAHWAGRG